MLMHFFVNPTTSSTTYDAKLTDIYDRVTWQTTTATGQINDTAVRLPCYGNWTLTIENASAGS